MCIYSKGFELEGVSELNLDGVQFNEVKTYKLFTFTSGTFMSHLRVRDLDHSNEIFSRLAIDRNIARTIAP